MGDQFDPDDNLDGAIPLCESPVAVRKQYTLCLAHAMFLQSVPNHGLLPAADPARCFTLAEEFVAEAMRRGY